MTALVQHDIEPPAILPDPAPPPPAFNPARPTPAGPRAEVDRVDALECTAGAMHDVGGRRVCDIHYLEVLHAYWEAVPNLVLHHYDEPRGTCGDFDEGSWS